MTWDYQALLSRFVDHRVCVTLHSQSQIRGTLANVCDDSVRLLDTVQVRDPDDRSWIGQNSWDEDSNARGSETVIRLEQILTITCEDERVGRSLPHRVSVKKPKEPAWELSSGQQLSDLLHELTDDEQNDHGLLSGSGDPDDLSELPAGLADALEIDPITLEVGQNLLTLTEDEHAERFMQGMTEVRYRVARQAGLILPMIRVRDNLLLEPRQYRILFHEQPVGEGELFLDGLLAQGTRDQLDSIPGLPGVRLKTAPMSRWIEPRDRARAEAAGCRVLEPLAVMIHHLRDKALELSAMLLTSSEVDTLLSHLADTNLNLVQDLIPTPLAPALLHRILQRLLTERVTIRPFQRIMESLAFHLLQTKDLEELVRHVREDLGDVICRGLCQSPGHLRAIRLADGLEQTLLSRLVPGHHPPAMPSEPTPRLLERLTRRLSVLAGTVLVTADLRGALALRVGRQLPQLSFLSSAEVPIGLRVDTLETIHLADLMPDTPADPPPFVPRAETIIPPVDRQSRAG